MSAMSQAEPAEVVRAIHFYGDFISPYSYLAWCQLPALAARHGRSVVVRPVLFAAVLQSLGTRGPAEVPPRRAYIAKDLMRRAHDLGVPFTVPPSHPFNPLVALRVAAQPMSDEERVRVTSALFDAVWRIGAGVEGEEAVARARAPLDLGARVDELLAHARTEAVKAQVRANTDALLAAGGFGVPTMIADGELFFGSDSLPQLDAFLRGADPTRSDGASAMLARWRDLPATARRPGS